MIEPESQKILKQEIIERMMADRAMLDRLRAEIRPLRDMVRRIQPRSTTAISLVATDGGNNSLQFDPFLMQIVRVVDSSHNEYCLEAVTPTTSVDDLGAKQFDESGNPRTALGKLMAFLKISRLQELSPTMRSNEDDRPINPSWIQVYRELVEWAILFHILREKDFGTDTLIIFDGLLRTKVFAGDLFKKYLAGLREGIESQEKKNRRKLYLAGVAKHSKVLTRYRLAMMLEEVLTTDYPTYLEIPRELEEKSYLWPEYARGDDWEREGGEVNKFVGGKMFFAKFGSGRRDPIWPVDIFLQQVVEAQQILGFMLADAINGFPVPCYPLCLQKAHESAALVDFDFDVLQDYIYEGIRSSLADEGAALDIFRLQDTDPAQKRYE